MRIALVTCERPLERDTDLDFLIPALTRAGAEVEAPGWSDPKVDWSSFDLAMLSSTWDYHERLGEFRAWLRSTGKRTRLVNPLDVVEWNLDKRYLRELEAAGAAIIPTIWAEPGREDEAVAEIAARGWEDLIVKPVVDLGARNLIRIAAGAAAGMLPRYGTHTMIQPYLPSVAAEGELSLVYLNGELSHALRKRPARGDFRIQPEYGGTHEAAGVPAAAGELAAAALAAAPGADPLYARVDMVALPDGSPALIELELVEPALYLDVDPPSADRLARVLLAAAA